MRALQFLLASGCITSTLVRASDHHGEDHQASFVPHDNVHQKRDDRSHDPGAPLNNYPTASVDLEALRPSGDCNPLSPWCPPKESETNIEDNALDRRDDWTRWACSRGIEWACNYPEPPQKREISFFSCSVLSWACELGAACACQYSDECDDGEYHGLIENGFSNCLNGINWDDLFEHDDDLPHPERRNTKRDIDADESNLNSAVQNDFWTHWACSRGVEFACNFERPDPPKTGDAGKSPKPVKGEASTTVFENRPGETVTAVMSIVETSPPVIQQVQDFGSSKFTEIASTVDGDPYKAVRKYMYDGTTGSFTIGFMSPTSTPTAKNGDHGKREIFDTVTILDKRPGHQTLNPEAATQTKLPTTEVTIINEHGTKATLSPTVNDDGFTILATKGMMNRMHVPPKSTCWATVFEDADVGTTSTKHPTEKESNAVTKTVKVQRKGGKKHTLTPSTDAHGKETHVISTHDAIKSNDGKATHTKDTHDAAKPSSESSEPVHHNAPTQKSNDGKETHVQGAHDAAKPSSQSSELVDHNSSTHKPSPHDTVAASSHHTVESSHSVATGPSSHDTAKAPHHDTAVSSSKGSAVPSSQTAAVPSPHVRIGGHNGITSQSQLPTVTKVLTKTVTKHDRYAMTSRKQCPYFCHANDWMKDTATIANIGGDTVRITKSVQLINNHTMIRAMPSAEAALLPLMWDPSYLHGWEHIIEMEMRDLREMHPKIDWDDVPRVAFNLRKHNGEIEPELSFKYALIMLLRGSQRTYYGRHYGGFPPLTSPDRHIATKTLGYINGSAIHMTEPTQTVDGHVLVADPLAKYKMFDPVHHAVVPTGSCGKKHRHAECVHERCMWDYMKPINITTAAPMAMYDYRGDQVFDYFTHRTELHWPHWGTSDSEGIYFPMRHTHITDAHGHLIHHVTREIPVGRRHKPHKRLHGDPSCFDMETCNAQCWLHAHVHRMPTLLPYILVPLLGFIALCALLCCCCCILHRRRKRDPEKESLKEKLRRRSSQPQEVVVNQATGQATDPATGNPVDPSTAATTAVLAGTAAGAAAAHNDGDGDKKGGDNDGKGTTGRRAEEGRGRVNFEDGGKPGADGPSKEGGGGAPQGGAPSSEAKPTEAPSGGAAPSEHAEPAPASAHQTDGTVDVSGRQMADLGSVRGRKRLRPEGGALAGLNLGF